MKKLMARARVGNKGFTLVELIVVVAIIAVLAVVIAPQYIQYVERSRVSNDITTAAAIEQAINVLCADGTIDAAATVTWDVDSGLKDDHVAAIEAITGPIGAAQSAAAREAAEVVWNVTITNGTPKVEVKAGSDYNGWGN